MIARAVLVLMFLGLSEWGVSQSSVILKNGQEIPVKKIRIGQFESVLILNDGHKKKIPNDSVYAIDYFDEGKLLYNKSNSFVAVETEGTINLYTQTVATGGYGGSGSMPTNGQTSYLYAEKQNAYDNLFATSIFQNKGNKKEILSRYVMDDPECAKIIKDDNFKYKMEDIVNLVRLYNVNKMDENVNPKTSDSTKVVFYRNNTSYECALYLDNGIEYSVDADNKIIVKLPQRSLFRVCLDKDRTLCSVIRTEPFVKYYCFDKDEWGKKVIKLSTYRQASFSIKHFAGHLNPRD